MKDAEETGRDSKSPEGTISRHRVWSFLNRLREMENPNKKQRERLQGYKRLRAEMEAELANEEERDLPDNHRLKDQP